MRACGEAAPLLCDRDHQTLGTFRWNTCSPSPTPLPYALLDVRLDSIAIRWPPIAREPYPGLANEYTERLLVSREPTREGARCVCSTSISHWRIGRIRTHSAFHVQRDEQIQLLDEILYMRSQLLKRPPQQWQRRSCPPQTGCPSIHHALLENLHRRRQPSSSAAHLHRCPRVRKPQPSLRSSSTAR